MQDASADFTNFHWMVEIIQSVDVGLIVLDKDYCIKLWNGFMTNHSGLLANHVLEKNLFTLFPDIPEDWFKKKAETVFLLRNRAFIIWEQRPFLFRFKNYRPITGTHLFMYQNVTLSPLVGLNGEVNHLYVTIYDVTNAVHDLAIDNNS